jgi:hypothetical protein
MRLSAAFRAALGVALIWLCVGAAKADAIPLEITSWNLTWNGNLLTSSLSVGGLDAQGREFSLSINNGILNLGQGRLTPDVFFTFVGNGENFRGDGLAPFGLLGSLGVAGLPAVTGQTPPGNIPLSLTLGGDLSLVLFSPAAMTPLYTITLTGLTGTGVFTVGPAPDLNSLRASGSAGAGTLTPAAAVPEPATLLLVVGGLAALGVRGRRRKG